MADLTDSGDTAVSRAGWCRPHVAATILRTSVTTVQRRMAAWLAGDRTDYALRCTRTASRYRLVDVFDAHQAAAQDAGQEPADRHQRAQPDVPGCGCRCMSRPAATAAR